MKKFTKQEIIELYGQVTMGGISFSQMTDILNDMVDETNDPQYKDGDFVVSEAGSILIFKKKVGDSIYDHAYFARNLILFTSSVAPTCHGIKRFATEEEKQKMLDALAKEGKRWNAEKLCIEDIPVRKFRAGDKVRIRHGVSSKTHYNIRPGFVEEMDDLIGKTMTVYRYDDWDNYVECDGMCWSFLEDWLELYVEELKKGDLAIFWDSDQAGARMGVYNQFCDGVSFPHEDRIGIVFKNAIKFESK